MIITLFETCKRQISILNNKYYESLFGKLRVKKGNIMISKLSQNNSNKSENEYYNLGSIFESSYYEYQGC